MTTRSECASIAAPHRSGSMVATMLVTVAALVSNCATARIPNPCLSEPTSDASAPTAHLLIEYRIPGGERTTLGIDPGTADVMVNADADDPVVVVYSAGDDQGLRYLRLDYDMKVYDGNTLVQPLPMLPQIEVAAPCPRSLLLGSHTFEPGGRRWRYTFATVAQNWMKTVTRSAMITIVTE